jgi:hypothetical protein
MRSQACRRTVVNITIITILFSLFLYAGCIDRPDTKSNFTQNPVIILDARDSYYADDPQIEDNRVVWVANDGSDYEIYFWNGTYDQYGKPSGIIKISNNNFQDIGPKISNGGVAWIGYEEGVPQIFYWNGTYGNDGIPEKILKLSIKNYSAFDPSIFKGKIAWKGLKGAINEIYYWNGKYKPDGTPEDPIIISDKGNRAYSPWVDENLVVFREFKGRNYEICFFNTTYKDEPERLNCTDGIYSAYYPSVSHGMVVWQRSDGNDTEIYLWDGRYDQSGNPERPIQISNNNFEDIMPQISNGRVAWEGFTGSNKKCIFYWDGTFKPNGQPSDPIVISNSTFDNISPRMDKNGDGIVWEGHFGSSMGIYYWDESFRKHKQEAVLISGETEFGSSPQIDNYSIVWKGSYKGNSTIYFMSLK